MAGFGPDACLAIMGSKRRRVNSAPSPPQGMPVLISEQDVPLGVRRLFQFLAVLDFLGNAPWANVRFPENEAMLRKFTATHLILIVGREEYGKHRGTLLSIIDSVSDLSKLVHLTWITNRQQGKTTTLAKFLAAMAMISPMGGPLIYVYSTTRDRAQELIDNAKRYIDWVLHDPRNVDIFTSWGLHVKSYTANNTIGFSLPSFLDNRIVNDIKARPKTADSCRGDAPRACMFDEVAFVSVRKASGVAKTMNEVLTSANVFACRRTFGSSLHTLSSRSESVSLSWRPHQHTMGHSSRRSPTPSLRLKRQGTRTLPSRITLSFAKSV